MNIATLRSYAQQIYACVSRRTDILEPLNLRHGIPATVVDDSFSPQPARVSGVDCVVDSARALANMARYTIDGVRLRGNNIPFEKRVLQGKGWDQAKKSLWTRFCGALFLYPYALTDWDIQGVEHLYTALRVAQNKGLPVVTTSTHQGLLDDPIVMMASLRLLNFNYETKCWLSTACFDNFNPQGDTSWDLFVREFSKVAGIIFLKRTKMSNGKLAEVPEDSLAYLENQLDPETMDRLRKRAQLAGADLRTFVDNLFTIEGDLSPTAMAALLQGGMKEFLGNLAAGKWGQIFLKGTRDPENVKPVKPGGGMAILKTNPILVPFAFHGMHRIMPKDPQLPWPLNRLPEKMQNFKYLPKPFQRVVVRFGPPIMPEAFDDLRAQPHSIETFLIAAERANSAIEALRPAVLKAYYGEGRAAGILQQEAFLEAEPEPASAAVVSGHLASSGARLQRTSAGIHFTPEQ